MKNGKVVALLCLVAILAGGSGFMLGRAAKKSEQPPATTESVLSAAEESSMTAASSIAESITAESAAESPAEESQSSIPTKTGESEQEKQSDPSAVPPATGEPTGWAEPTGDAEPTGSAEPTASPEPTASAVPTVTAAPTETPAPAEQEPENSVEYAIKISTSYGDLYYPDQWEDYIKTEQTREGNILVVSFSAEIKGRTFRMFDARIGDNDAIGTLTGPDGKTRNVGFASYETENAEGLSADEQNRLNAMSEDINFVIDHLQ